MLFLFSILVKLILYLFLASLTLVICKDISCYIYWVKYYKKQGVKYEYLPLIGLMYLFMTPLQKLLGDHDPKDDTLYKAGLLKGNDMLMRFRKLFHKERDADIIALNHTKANPTLVIKNPDMIAEFFNKENDVAIRTSPVKFPLDMGFFTKNGPHALNMRKVFSKFFFPS